MDNINTRLEIPADLHTQIKVENTTRNLKRREKKEPKKTLHDFIIELIGKGLEKIQKPETTDA